MTMELLVCWKCGASLAAEPLPLARVSECPSCNADLHVCRLCEFYDTAVAKSCREPVADEVLNKERANFCDYFQPCPDAWTAPDAQPEQAARNALDALFGGNRVDTDAAAGRDAADAARRQLDELFGPGKD